MRPNDFPDNSVPTNSFFAQIPSLNFLSAIVIFLHDASRCAIVISTTLFVDALGVLQTVILFSVAALISILSTPTPALPININPLFSFFEAEMTSRVIFVALLTTTASKFDNMPLSKSASE